MQSALSMLFPNLKLDKAHFLAKVWQTKPLVIRQACKGFIDPIDEHDLASLALEPNIDSRIVSLHEKKWSVTHGPFESFDEYCVGKWTLMVQGVDRWVEDISALSSLFNMIPNWRFDDVMVSFSVPGAGVGPHVDQYDVFLLQGKGKRRWQVGNPNDACDSSPHPDLQQVAPFEPMIDVVLDSGDILYIPPGWPHCGTTVENSMTYSVGFRAPNAVDLLQPFNNSVLNKTNMPRFTDPKGKERQYSHDVSNQELNKLTTLLADELQSNSWKYTLLEYLSDQQLPLERPDPAYTREDIVNLISSHPRFTLVPGCKVITNKSFPTTLFVNGEGYEMSAEIKSQVLQLISPDASASLSHLNQRELIDLIIQWLNEGLLVY